MTPHIHNAYYAARAWIITHDRAVWLLSVLATWAIARFYGEAVRNDSKTVGWWSLALMCAFLLVGFLAGNRFANRRHAERPLDMEVNE